MRLGDRILSLRSPAIRGDDAADLQQMLSTLGFFSGRINGIWGVESSLALGDFQQNAGIVGDSVCGPRTIVALEQVMRPLAGANAVSQLRELHRLIPGEAGPGLAGQRIAIGEIGGLSTVLAATRRTLIANGAEVLPLNHPSWSAQAVQANRFGAIVYIAAEVRKAPPSVNYFQGRHFTSVLGQRLAQDLAERLEPLLGHLECCGMALPVLRESQMPAVLMRVENVVTLLKHGQEIATTVGTATGHLLSKPVPD